MGRRFHWWNTYSPPKFKNSNPKIENFIRVINYIILKLSTENWYAIFMGDFNVNIMKTDWILKHQAFSFICKTQFLKHCTT